jgi:S-adenosyl-L-methionine hydrolase (adenosine-forming)
MVEIRTHLGNAQTALQFYQYMPARLITLTTDFGLSDHFVGVMKGVIAGIAPAARVIDICHDIAPYNITEAAFVIAEAWPYFPKATIHVVVVDPGVGSSRRPIVVEAGGSFFIAPDNGVLSIVFGVPHKVRVISNPRLMRRAISRTFHGRDVFAPAAAHLAKGAQPAQFGKRIHDFVRADAAAVVRLSATAWRANILKVDRFGNLITSFLAEHFPGVTSQPFEMRVGREKIRRVALHYAEIDIGELFVIVGSSGYLEIAANQASAAGMLGCGAGAAVELELY